MFNQISFKFAIFILFSCFSNLRCVRALGAARDPNGHADAGRCPRVRAATQTAQNGRPSASVWVARLEMPLGHNFQSSGYHWNFSLAGLLLRRVLTVCVCKLNIAACLGLVKFYNEVDDWYPPVSFFLHCTLLVLLLGLERRIAHYCYLSKLFLFLHSLLLLNAMLILLYFIFVFCISSTKDQD
jgi:hypothetical protein